MTEGREVADSVPYRSLCFVQCSHSSSPGGGRSVRFPMIGFGSGPGGRGRCFGFERYELSRYTPRAPNATSTAR